MNGVVGLAFVWVLVGDGGLQVQDVLIHSPDRSPYSSKHSTSREIDTRELACTLGDILVWVVPGLEIEIKTIGEKNRDPDAKEKVSLDVK